MAEYYFDLTNGSDSNSGLTRGDPKKNPITVTVGANDRVRLRRGTENTAPVGTRAMFVGASGVVIEDYDDGDNPPKIGCASNSIGVGVGTDVAGWIIANIWLDNIGAGSSRRGITNATTASSEAVAIDGIIRGVKITGVKTDGANDCNGISVFGAGISVEDCEFDDIATDAIWARARNVRIINNRIAVTGHSQDGRSLGDCIQLGGAGSTDFGDFLIRGNRCDHSADDHKQGIICSGAAGAGGIIEYNEVIGPENASVYVGIYPGHTNCIVRNNYVEGGLVCINSPSNGVHVLSNIVFATSGRGIDVGGSAITDCVAEGNVVVGVGQSAPGIRHNQGTATGSVIRRNLISNFSQGIMRVVAASVEERNIVTACPAPFVSSASATIDRGAYSSTKNEAVPTPVARQAPAPGWHFGAVIGRRGALVVRV